MEHNSYIIHQAGHGPGMYLKVTDAMKGVQVGQFSPRGEIQGTWVISGNQVSFVCKQPDGSLLGCVHKLPSGSLITTFRA
tara:strand:- start:2628 stop:2867 length:240 start_codon:yes stop_codon:yes gene_type:complete